MTSVETIPSKSKFAVISEQADVDLSNAFLDPNLSAVNFDEEGKFFYMTIDKALFSDPVSTIRKILDAHGFVPNLENVLSCLDSFNFSVHTLSSAKDDVSKSSPAQIGEYLPCIRFELPQKNSVGSILKSFYDEIAKYEAKAADASNKTLLSDSQTLKNQGLKAEIQALKKDNKELTDRVKELTYQLSTEQKSLSRASKALDSQRMLPDNVKTCRIDQIDLKQRNVKVKSNRKVIDIPTHLFDRVPQIKARCLVTFDEDEDKPLGIIFFDHEEFEDLENRIAEVLFVEGDSFKARDSMRNEFQIKAVNPMEAETITSLRRGMKVVISISEGYLVRFSILDSIEPEQFKSQVHEQFIVHDIARNQLITRLVNDQHD